MDGTIYRRDILKRAAVFAVLLLIVCVIFNIRADYINLNYQFNGRVDSISYNEKGTPLFFIKGNKYALDGGKWNHLINKGDSMVKKKNSQIVKLLKPNGEVIIK